jgi:formylglycine-generating enzyme required for sulfatase activity
MVRGARTIVLAVVVPWATACGVSFVGSATSDGADAAPDAAAHDAPTSIEDVTDGGTTSSDCPSGRGPAMVKVAASVPSFCIDTTEVTESQWASFRAAGAGTSLLPPECAFKATYNLGSTQGAMRPVGNVDWCDAFAFCAWASKRLCSPSEWQTACTGGTGRTYPYGNTFDGSACNGGQFGQSTDVGSLPGCQGAAAGLYDMSGNIDEWSLRCATSTGAGDSCSTHGGDYSNDPPEELTCTSAYPRSRSTVLAFVGFRCCK